MCPGFPNPKHVKILFLVFCVDQEEILQWSKRRPSRFRHAGPEGSRKSEEKTLILIALLYLPCHVFLGGLLL